MNNSEKSRCESFGKSFWKAGNLKKHINTVHDVNKSHKCEYYGKSFPRAGDLKKHIHTVHEGHRD